MAPLANKKECWGHNLQIFSGLQISKPKKFNFFISSFWLSDKCNQSKNKEEFQVGNFYLSLQENSEKW